MTPPSPSPPSIAELLAGLSESRWAARRQVVRALAERGDEAIPGLLAELSTERATETRIAAAMDALAGSVGDVEAGLLGLAASPDASVAADGAQVLGRRGSLRAVPQLCSLTRSPNDNVALAAIEALGKIGSPAAVEPLLEALAHPNLFRSLPALDALGRLGDPRAIAPLAARLSDRRFAIEAARALGQTRDPAAAPPLLAVVARGASALTRAAITALDELRQGVGELYGDTARVDETVTHAGEVLLNGLLGALTGADDRERARIATFLGLVGDEGAVDDLQRLLDVGGAATVPAAARALDRLHPEGRRALAARIERADAELARALLPWLSEGPSAGRAAARCLLDPNGDLRAEACRFFARTRTLGHADALFALLDDEQLDVAEAALVALVALVEVDLDVPTRARLALAADAPAARRAGLRILEALGSTEDGSAMARAVADADATVRTAALRALARDESAVGRVARVAALGHHDPRTRAAAAQSLEGIVTDADVRIALLAATADVDGWVRYHAARSLARGEGAAVTSAIVKLLDDRARYVQLAAIAALGDRSLEAVGPVLRARCLVGADADMGAAGLVSLARLRDPEIARLVHEALTTADPGTRVTLVGALAGLADDEVVPTLRAAAEDEDDTVRKVAVGALGERSDAAAAQALLQLLTGRSAALAQEVLARPSPARVDVVAGALSAELGPRAHQLAGALVRMQTATAIDALLGVLRVGTEAGRAAAAKALRVASTPATRQALEDVRLHDASAALRAIAAVG